MSEGSRPATPVPTELRVSKDKQRLAVSFAGGESYGLEAELLRVTSPSAEVQGHGPDQRVTVHGKRKVEIIAVEPVGNYAVRIRFDDMHSTGIYSWTFLRELGQTRDEKWSEYLAELEQKNLSRDPVSMG